MAYIIKNFEVFKTECSKLDKQGLRAMLWNWAFQRTIQECVLVNMFNQCDKDGVLTPKSKVLESFSNTLEGERILIGLLGRKEAAKVYGIFEGITSDVKTVDYILNNDSVSYYKKLIESGKELCKDCGEPIEKCICPDLAQAEYNMQSEAEHARRDKTRKKKYGKRSTRIDSNT